MIFNKFNLVLNIFFLKIIIVVFTFLNYKIYFYYVILKLLKIYKFNLF